MMWGTLEGEPGGSELVREQGECKKKHLAKGEKKRKGSFVFQWD